MGRSAGVSWTRGLTLSPLGERVSRSGVFISRSGTGEGVTLVE
jgi:hypothetical protein